MIEGTCNKLVRDNETLGLRGGLKIKELMYAIRKPWPFIANYNLIWTFVGDALLNIISIRFHMMVRARVWVPISGGVNTISNKQGLRMLLNRGG